MRTFLNWSRKIYTNKKNIPYIFFYLFFFNQMKRYFIRTKKSKKDIAIFLAVNVFVGLAVWIPYFKSEETNKSEKSSNKNIIQSIAKSQ